MLQEKEALVFAIWVVSYDHHMNNKATLINLSVTK